MSVTSIGSTAPSHAVAALVGIEDQAPAAGLHVVPDAVRDPQLRPSTKRAAAVLPVLVGLLPAVLVAVLLHPAVMSWACVVAWFVVAATRAMVRRRPAVVRAWVRADLRVGAVLVFLVSLAGVSGLVPLTDVRRGIAVVLAAAGTTALVRLLQPRASLARRVVLVGSQQDVESYAASVRETEAVVVGSYVMGAGPAPAVQSGAGVPTTTSLETLEQLVSGASADIVLVLPGAETDAEAVRRLTWALENHPVTVAVHTPVSAVAAHRLRTSELGDQVVVELGPIGASSVEVAVKNVIDRVAAAVILVLASPLLLLLVAAVRFDSTGSGLFVQTRVGRDGELFRMLKLRTMYVDAESMKQALLEDNDSDGVLFKIRRDPRVTRVGYWLRRSSLDELPQLLNVLRGEMSLVGPRPALPSEVAFYDDNARRRLVVKPGITGLWQVSGRSDLLWDESLRLDLHYADNWRLLDDLAIAARTLGAVTTARGAY